METLDDPLIGAHIGLSDNVGMVGLLDALYLSAETVGDAFDVTARYLPTVSTVGRAMMAYGDDTLTVTGLIPESVAPVLNLQASTYGLAYQIFMARRATGRSIVPACVTFVHEAPRRYRELVETLGVDGIEFGREANSVTFRRADLDVPLLSADPVLAAVLRRHAADRIAALVPRSRPAGAEAPWPELLRGFLASGFVGRDVSLPAAARHLAVSPRALQEHLRETGTSWRAEVEASRAGLAADLLREGRLTIASIGARLGYSDARVSCTWPSASWTGRGHTSGLHLELTGERSLENGSVILTYAPRPPGEPNEAGTQQATRRRNDQST